MTKPKLIAKTPDLPEANGLIGEHEALIAAPKQRRFAVVEIDVVETVQPVHGDTYVRVMLTHIEPAKGKDAEELEATLGRLFTKRTGQAVRQPDEPDVPLDLDVLDDSVE